MADAFSNALVHENGSNLTMNLHSIAPIRDSIMTALTRPAYIFDGMNYSSWSMTFLEFLNAHRLRHHLMDPPPDESDSLYAEWSYLESAVCTWICQSVDNKIMRPISATRWARALWQRLETMYANKNNMSKTVRLYKELFACKQGSQTLQEYYGAMESIINDLAFYQTSTTNLVTLTRYRDELRVGAILSGLRPELANMIRGQVLARSCVMPIEEIFSAALWVHDNVPTSLVSPSTDISALATFRGPPKPLGNGNLQGKSHNSFSPCKYYGKMSLSAEKCWKEFGKLAWVLAAYRG